MARPAEVWITGLGAHTAAGPGIAALHAALFELSSLAHPVDTLAGYWAAAAAEPDVGRAGRRLSRGARLFLAAAREAWQGAGLEARSLDPERIAVIEASSLGPTGDLLAAERERVREGLDRPVRPTLLLKLLFGAGGDAFAQEVGARGPVFAIAAGSASGAVAVIEAWQKVRDGVVDIAIAGGAEAPLDPEVLRVFAAAGILAPPDAGLPCRPFDTDRRGTMLGEAAGILVLERADHAVRRGAAPLAVLGGGAATGDGCSLVAPDPEGRDVARAAKGALRETRLERVGWLKAHGTGTRLNDAAECRGLSGLTDRAPVTSLKPLIGHCLGASGAVELVAAVLAMRDRVVPPTLGTTRVDPALGSCRVPLEPEPMRGDTALLLSASLGGRSAAIALRRCA